MTRGHRRSEQVQADKPAAKEEASASIAAAANPAELPRTRLAWYWRLTLFLWATSFIFLFVYELLSALFRLF